MVTVLNIQLFTNSLWCWLAIWSVSNYDSDHFSPIYTKINLKTLQRSQIDISCPDLYRLTKLLFQKPKKTTRIKNGIKQERFCEILLKSSLLFKSCRQNDFRFLDIRKFYLIDNETVTQYNKVSQKWGVLVD